VKFITNKGRMDTPEWKPEGFRYIHGDRFKRRDEAPELVLDET